MVSHHNWWIQSRDHDGHGSTSERLHPRYVAMDVLAVWPKITGRVASRFGPHDPARTGSWCSMWPNRRACLEAKLLYEGSCPSSAWKNQLDSFSPSGQVVCL